MFLVFGKILGLYRWRLRTLSPSVFAFQLSPGFLFLTTTLLFYKLLSGFQFPSDRWILHILAVKANKFMEDRFA